MTRFAFLADPQLGCRATFSGLSESALASLQRRDIFVDQFPPTDGHVWDLEQLEKAIDVIEQEHPDFVVFGGDMVDDARNPDQLADFLTSTERVACTVRRVPGNHDCAFDGEQPTSRSLAHYEEAFGPDTYSFEADGATFIVLNTTVLHRPERVPDVLDAQLTFLRRELETAAGRTGPIILLGHHPLFLRDHDEPNSYWNVPRRLREPILEAIETFGISAMFAGHYHRNAHAFSGPFEMVTSGPVGFPLGADPSGVRLVEVKGQRIRHEYRPLS